MKKKINMTLVLIVMVLCLPKTIFASDIHGNRSVNSKITDDMAMPVTDEVKLYTNFSGKALNADVKRTPDSYEPNDTKATAYPYSNIAVMNKNISMEASLYTLGLKTANLTTADDVDWYKVNLTKGTAIFADLRNLGTANYNMRVYFTAADGTERYYSTEQEVFNGRPEKYLRFSAQITGTYYVKIYSLGDAGTSNYYFYIGPKLNQKYGISNLCMNSVQMWGTSYQGSFTNLEKFFPVTAKIDTLSILNRVAGKKVNIDKMVRIGGKTCYSGGETITGLNGVALNQVIYIGGKTANGTIYDWTPTLNGSFTCEMAPYPGNEVK